MRAHPVVAYVLRRGIQAVFTLWAAFTIAFCALYILPGDPAILILGGLSGSAASEVQLKAINSEYGFDKPVTVQYIGYITRALHGDFGTSYQTKAPVLSTILDATPSTLLLISFAMTCAIIIAVAISTITVYSQTPSISRALDILPPLGISLPTFFTGLVLLNLFSFKFRIFPAVGGHGFLGVVLPGLTLAIPAAAIIAQVLSSSLRTAISEPYIEVAKAKGASRQRLFLRHAYRNAMLPVVTVAGTLIVSLIAYSTVVDVVFSRVGIGYLLQRAVVTRDIPVVLAIVIIVEIAYVVVNLVVDLLYPLLDPRLRVGTSTSSKSLINEVDAS